MRNYYQILGVMPSASLEEIKERYRFLAKAYHPDRFTSEKEKTQASKEMQLINEAYAVLSNPDQRAIYDRKIGVANPEYAESKQQTADSENADEKLKYIASLVEKWNVFVSSLPQNPKRMELTQSVRDSLIDLSRVLRKMFPNYSHTIGDDQINKSITFIVVASIALGAESSGDNFEKKYRQEDLEAHIAVAGLAHWFALMEKAAGHSVVENLYGRMMALVYALIKTSFEDGFKFAKERNQKNFYQQSQANHLRQDYCQSCYRYTCTVHTSFSKNIGMLIARSYQKIDGNLCNECIERYFWSFTMKTALFGWWGLISMIVSPFIILLNIINYLIAIFSLGYKASLVPIKWGWKFVALFVLVILSIGFFPALAPRDYNSVLSYSKNSPTQTSTRSSIIKTSYPTYTSLPTYPTQTLKPSIISTSSPVSSRPLGVPDNCKKWSEIITSFEGKRLCVYGQIQSVYWGDDGRFFIRFSKNNNDAFRFVVVYGYYEVQANECVYATGVIRKYGKMPYIELGDKDILYVYRCN